MNCRFLSGMVVLLTAMAAGSLTGCGNKGNADGPPADPGVEVVVDRPAVTNVEELVTAVGTVEANERVELKPQAAGLIEAIYFTEGQRVRKGDKLFALDSREEEAAMAQAESEEKLAKANLERARSLLGTKAIAQQDVEQLESQLEVRVAVRKVQQEKLSKRLLLAPCDGVLGPRLISPGQYVTMGTPLATLVDDSQMKVRFRIPERQLARMRLEQTGRLRVSAYPERVFTGKIDLINPEVDETTRTVELRLRAPNPEAVLKAGMFARVEIVVGLRPNAVVIPESALVASLDQFIVYAVENGLAKTRPVKLGVRLPGQAEVREGLAADQPIVVSGTQKIAKDGVKVIPAKMADPVKPAAP